MRLAETKGAADPLPEDASLSLVLRMLILSYLTSLIEQVSEPPCSHTQSRDFSTYILVILSECRWSLSMVEISSTMTRTAS